MNSYLEVLQAKAKKVNAPIEDCMNDLECIIGVIASTVSQNLSSNDLNTLIDKAYEINADISDCKSNKECILDAIALQVEDVLENEYHEFLNSTQNLEPKHLLNPFGSGDFGNFGDSG